MIYKIFLSTFIISEIIFANNYDPTPPSEVLILKHTHNLENYSWGPIFAPEILGSVCDKSKRIMCSAESYSNAYIQNIHQLRGGFSLF